MGNKAIYLLYASPIILPKLIQFKILVNTKRHVSVNPMLRRNASRHPMGMTGENFCTDHGKLPYFDFSTVEDPYRVCMDKLPNGSRHEHASAVPSFLNSSASATGSKINNHDERHGGDAVCITKVSSVNSHLDLKDHNVEDMSTIAYGGSSWASLLVSSRRPLTNAVTQSNSCCPHLGYHLTLLLTNAYFRKLCFSILTFVFLSNDLIR
ncbi:Gamma-tubulin complex component [Quillaja saponaria]|uniref:Gamma-tubulin complex component n=1 Tax=Quillaja saponaria TaxID=32244 RepID=A0AAD7PMQ7_QUISA|nr:Gamma-tubulin complex component [Quillaja saponaria]